MKSLPKSYVRLSAAALGLSVLAGCTSETPGTAEPTSPVAPNSPSQVPDIFAGLKACDLLDKALQGQGFPASKPERSGGPNGCGTDKSLYGGIGLALQSGMSIKETTASPDKVFDGEVNGRLAAQIREPLGASGGCVVMVSVGEKNRIYLSAALKNTDEACAFAFEVAKKVEPLLPKAN